MPSHMHTWLPYAIFGMLIIGYGLVMLIFPKYRNQYRIRPAAGREPGPSAPGATSTQRAVLLHYTPLFTAWLVGSMLPVGLAIFGMTKLPWPKAVVWITAAVSLFVVVAVLADLRLRGPVQSCYFDEHGGVSLIRRDVTVPFDLNHYRYVDMYTITTGETGTTYPNMLLLCRDRPPGIATRLSSRLLPRVTDERVVVFLRRWRDADGGYVTSDELAARFYRACAHVGHTPSKRRGFFTNAGWEVRP
jgi:hypothetical protein